MEKPLPLYWLNQLQKNIADHWNEPAATVVLKNSFYSIEFIIRGFYEKDLVPETVWYNTNQGIIIFG
jgi:hypothetical protein